jgi:hypothetical protein
MRLPRMTIQRQMIAVALLAISLVALFELGPDLQRRWGICRGFAEAHAFYSRHCLGVASRSGPEQARVWRERADVESQISRTYRLAWLFPWRLYTMVD